MVKGRVWLAPSSRVGLLRREPPIFCYEMLEEER
jgi:hypothetical protein